MAFKCKDRDVVDFRKSDLGEIKLIMLRHKVDSHSRFPTSGNQLFRFWSWGQWLYNDEFLYVFLLQEIQDV